MQFSAQINKSQNISKMRHFSREIFNGIIVVVVVKTNLFLINANYSIYIFYIFSSFKYFVLTNFCGIKSNDNSKDKRKMLYYLVSSKMS